MDYEEVVEFADRISMLPDDMIKDLVAILEGDLEAQTALLDILKEGLQNDKDN